MEASSAGRLGRGDRPVRRRAGQIGLLRGDDGVVRVQRRHAVVAPKVGGNRGAAGEVVEGTILPMNPPPLTPPRRGTGERRLESCSPPGRGWGWVVSRRAGTMRASGFGR